MVAAARLNLEETRQHSLAALETQELVQLLVQQEILVLELRQDLLD
jgi:hypothetical protein